MRRHSATALCRLLTAWRTLRALNAALFFSPRLYASANAILAKHAQAPAHGAEPLPSPFHLRTTFARLLRLLRTDFAFSCHSYSLPTHALQLLPFHTTPHSPPPHLLAYTPLPYTSYTQPHTTTQPLHHSPYLPPLPRTTLPHSCHTTHTESHHLHTLLPVGMGPGWVQWDRCDRVPNVLTAMTYNDVATLCV